MVSPFPTSNGMEITRPKPYQHFPPEAKKVFEGVLYDVYQWQQTRYDGSVATYERLRRGDSVVIIPVTAAGKIVINRQQQPGTDWYTAVPCGGIDPGEPPEAAARRELMEETGYVPGELDLWFAQQLEHRVDWAVYVFIARRCTRAAVPGGTDPGERIENQEVSFDEFLHLASRDDFQNMNLAPKLLAAMLSPDLMSALKKRLGLMV